MKMAKATKVFDVRVEEVVVHSFKVRATSKRDAEAAAEEVFDNRDYSGKYVECNGVPERTEYKVAVAKNQRAKVENKGA